MNLQIRQLNNKVTSSHWIWNTLISLNSPIWSLNTTWLMFAKVVVMYKVLIIQRKFSEFFGSSTRSDSNSEFYKRSFTQMYFFTKCRLYNVHNLIWSTNVFAIKNVYQIIRFEFRLGNLHPFHNNSKIHI